MRIQALCSISAAIAMAMISSAAFAQGESKPAEGASDVKLSPAAMEILCKNYPLNSRCKETAATPGSASDTKTAPDATATPSGTTTTPDAMTAPSGTMTAPDATATPPAGGTMTAPDATATPPAGGTMTAPDSTTPGGAMPADPTMTPPAGGGTTMPK
jgi:hypothetical protein